MLAGRRYDALQDMDAGGDVQDARVHLAQLAAHGTKLLLLREVFGRLAGEHRQHDQSELHHRAPLANAPPLTATDTASASSVRLMVRPRPSDPPPESILT